MSLRWPLRRRDSEDRQDRRGSSSAAGPSSGGTSSSPSREAGPSTSSPGRSQAQGQTSSSPSRPHALGQTSSSPSRPGQTSSSPSRPPALGQTSSSPSRAHVPSALPSAPPTASRFNPRWRAQRSSSSSTAIEQLRSRTRAGTGPIGGPPGTASAHAAPTAGGGNHSRTGAGTFADSIRERAERDRGRNGRPRDGSVSSSLDRRTREALQTSSAPAALRSNTPPPYTHHSLDRSPLPNPMVLDDRPRIPPPIHLRSLGSQPQSKLGSLKIHVPGWGLTLVRPPRPYDLHPLEANSAAREPPAEDTVLSGVLEVTMKERKRVRGISVGVQSVTALNMGGVRGWEEDGIFERGVEVLSGDSEGIWLEKGSQSFSFSILLPATLATHDYHDFGRVAYILSARVEGIPIKSGLTSMFKNREIPTQGDVCFLADFQAVISRSERMAQHTATQMSRGSSRDGSPSLAPLSLGVDPSPLASPMEESFIAFGETATRPSPGGLYHRRQSSDMNSVGLTSGTFANGSGQGSPAKPSPLRRDDAETASIASYSSVNGDRSEKQGWLGGDICTIRKLSVHANPSTSSGVLQLDLRKEGYVAGLGPWRFSATSDAFSIASVMMVRISIPLPSPQCTIFFVRLLLSQTYAIYSPRTPNERPYKPQGPKNHIVYQVGRPHKSGESVLGHEIEALWRGPEAGGKRSSAPDNGWRTRAVARLPTHQKMRPSTNPGTITPIRVTHELLLRIFYSIEGESVDGLGMKGPGEVRMCQVRIPITVPSCMCSVAALNLPTYESAAGPVDDPPLDADLSDHCQCAVPFHELSTAAMSRQQAGNEADYDDWHAGWNCPDSAGPDPSERQKYHEATGR